jgi:hypothetical protein
MVLLAPTTIGAAGTITGGGAAYPPTAKGSYRLRGMFYLSVQATFLYGAGGTSVDAYIQTTLDNGASWMDIMNFHFTGAAATKVSSVVSGTALAAAVTPTDGSLASNTILSGLMGPTIRYKVVSVGTYTGATSLALYMMPIFDT